MINEDLDLNQNQCDFSKLNYWREIEKNITEELKNLKGITLIVHNSVEFTDIIEFLQNYRPGEFLAVLYISLVRSYDYMKNALELKTLDDKRMIFIDCVSGYAFPVDDKVNSAFYHKPPQTLEELKEIIQFGIEKINPELVILDSLSQFINFSHSTEEEFSELCNFLNTLKQNQINTNQKVFMLLYDNKLGIMESLPKNQIDNILKMEKIKKENFWK